MFVSPLVPVEPKTVSSPRLAGHPLVPGHGLRQVILITEDKYLKML
jgi:hypothetical protein